MNFSEELDRLEELYYGEWEEDKEKLIPELEQLHLEAGAAEDSFNRFLVEVADRFGGAYIPYLFWDKLTYFDESPAERVYLQELIRIFINSNFEEEEQKKLKPLLVVYFSKEKPFELDKIRYQLLDKAYPPVQEYFNKLLDFVQKNQKATEMYCEKFDLLRNFQPNFDLLGLPVTQLRDRLQGV